MHAALKKYLEGRIELSDQQEAFLNQCFIQRNTKRNEILVAAGSMARHLYLVAEGCLRVFVTNSEGGESTRFLIFENRMGTAFPSFINRQPSVAAIQSPESSVLLMLSFETRELIHRTIPGWESMERKQIEQDYIEAIQRIENLITKDSKSRYNFLMKNNPEMIQRLPAKMIADYLGISAETLSRLKARK